MVLSAFGGTCYNCQEPGLVVAIAMPVVTINASLAEHATTVEKLATRSRTAGSYKRIRTSIPRASMEEMLNMAHCNQRCHRREQRRA
jgi:hypothetical protein